MLKSTLEFIGAWGIWRAEFSSPSLKLKQILTRWEQQLKSHNVKNKINLPYGIGHKSYETNSQTNF